MVHEDPPTPDADELERLGVYDPHAPDAANNLELIRFVLALGATLEDVAAAANLGELALDLTLRPRGPLTLGEAAAAAGIDWPTTERLMTAVGISTDPGGFVTDDGSPRRSLVCSASRWSFPGAPRACPTSTSSRNMQI